MLTRSKEAGRGITKIRKGLAASRHKGRWRDDAESPIAHGGNLLQTPRVRASALTEASQRPQTLVLTGLSAAVHHALLR